MTIFDQLLISRSEVLAKRVPGMDHCIVIRPLAKSVWVMIYCLKTACKGHDVKMWKQRSLKQVCGGNLVHNNLIVWYQVETDTKTKPDTNCLTQSNSKIFASALFVQCSPLSIFCVLSSSLECGVWGVRAMRAVWLYSGHYSLPSTVAAVCAKMKSNGTWQLFRDLDDYMVTMEQLVATVQKTHSPLMKQEPIRPPLHYLCSCNNLCPSDNMAGGSHHNCTLLQNSFIVKAGTRIWLRSNLIYSN